MLVGLWKIMDSGPDLVAGLWVDSSRIFDDPLENGVKYSAANYFTIEAKRLRKDCSQRNGDIGGALSALLHVAP